MARGQLCINVCVIYIFKFEVVQQAVFYMMIRIINHPKRLCSKVAYLNRFSSMQNEKPLQQDKNIEDDGYGTEL